MWLQEFKYYFSVTGAEGGLFSVEFEFCPAAAPGCSLSPAQEKAAVREVFSALDALLEQAARDGVLGEVKKEPTLTDSPHTSSVGFVYGRSISKEAKLEYHLHKTNRQAPATLQLEVKLGHKTNLSLFERVMALPNLQVSEQAQNVMRQMRRVMETKDGGELDPVKFLEESDV